MATIHLGVFAFIPKHCLLRLYLSIILPKFSFGIVGLAAAGDTVSSSIIEHCIRFFAK